MFINEIWDFKSINMAHELGIAGEFIYDSARKAMALRNLYNDYELNSILSLIDWIDDLHEEIEDNDERKERHELLSLIGNVSVLFDDWDDADF